MKTIDNDIKMGQLKNVYLLYGTEDYLKRQYRDKLKHALVEPDDTMNFSAYEGKDINPKELIDLSETLPFFKEKRMILVENSGFFKNSCDDLAEYMSQVPESTCFVFVEEEVDKRSKLFKAASRAGSAVEFETPKEDMLIRWILGRIQREGKKITQSVMQLFLSKTGSDMENIDKELEKLICYTLDKTEISAADVEAICTGQTENKIFEMIDAISAKNQKKALDLYYDLLALKEAPMRILFLIARQFQNLLLIKSMSAKGYPAVSIAKTAGMPSFAVQKNLRQAGAFKINQLKDAIEDCGQAEEDVKTGRMADQLAVELLIVKYSA
ncbi:MULTISPECIES: DNA polymerase III subunit delta [unclassified Roseburia]|uniref:DNA polymerase III subunit delta n=1 Tax=unclassified Roseburia TaxID=2637578 RepID=UPI000E436355|nr:MULTISPECIES: DNA polymerase III subunit delta [unclassified Roseburia]RGF46413.1 DNA polymerase III subunit delta [Roseburia sp. AF42-8]RHQ41504.1 DNA polymerase III subunit delta [Roseburia sp. AF25-25LB]RHQ44315.1 DNA polymerase III subunit delta [Roseburia sp. AF25-18LB]RHQ51487.1 DNA polymerase III subunit delta [Roseburia sp. AF25-15LB]RHQ52622.1 DNA polymerase III subunit delta [Roseburia sp. AF25-13LB]